MIPLGPSPEGTCRGPILRHHAYQIDFVDLSDAKRALAS